MAGRAELWKPRREFKLIVFKAARDGKLYRLKVFLDNKSKEKVSILVSAKTSGSTPLIMGCRNGHTEVVKFLLEKCHADIEQEGSVLIEGKTIEGASPLWAAAVAGHLKIVQILVRSGASVNSTTESNYTPLHAACVGGHFDIAKYLIQHGADINIANRYGRTSLMFACYKGHYELTKYLLGCGIEVNRKCSKGNTALHDCVQAGSLAILKVLLKHGATLEADSWGTTPLLSAAIAGQTSIVEYFIEEYNCTKLEKVNALELLGATFIDKRHDRICAHDCWEKAMQLRYENGVFPLEKPNTRSSLENYIGVMEVRTFHQLEELRFDPDEMRIQALLVRERILGPGHPETIYNIRCRGSTYSENGDFNRCIQLWLYALDNLQRIHECQSQMTQSTLLHFVILFNYMISESLSLERDSRAVTFKDIYHVFQRALKEIETAIEISVKQKADINDNGLFHRTLINAMHLVALMCRLQPYLNKKEEMEMKKAIYHLVNLNPRTKNGWTPLHYACFKDSSVGHYPAFTFPSPEVVKLLLEVGACPNAIDSSNNTPLHTAALNKSHARTNFEILLYHGAHLDLCNDKRQTPLQLIEESPSRFNVYPLRYLNLQCLCAEVIRKNKIPYEGLVHKKLEEFIYSH